MKTIHLWFTLFTAVVITCTFGQSAQGQETGKSLKWKVAIGRFSNETQYGKGIFYDRENDPIAKQAQDILAAKLVASGKFILLERSDAEAVAQEVTDGTSEGSIKADYVILGSVTEFGRKTTGQTGLFTAEKTQQVEAAVNLRLVDVATGIATYSEEAKGYANNVSKSTLGLGGSSGYDASLGDKAISAAIDQLVENIINKCSDKPWRTYLISMDQDGTIIAGGASQGLSVGDRFDIYSKGKKVKNPQTGGFIELPGKKVGALVVTMTLGETPMTEFSIVDIVEGDIDSSDLSQYYIQEIK
ncbi:CsgG/HfaB family protein [Porphyromonas uenonis]|uniref:CsgG/HfaB family protein n=1 Tax=Porphyromonas uenonis TaxID=281920 RepID=UPI0026ED4E9A|nr:CsgG/HfaB family protein [Porphyromonas uenonis]